MLYILSISLQVSGAVILLLWSFNGMRKKEIIRNYFPGTMNIAFRDDNNFCTLDKNRLQYVTNEACKNMIAFTYIILGYMLAYFSQENNFPPEESVALTLVFSFVITILGVCISKTISEIKYSKDLIVPYSLLESFGVDTVPTEKEIDAIISGKSSS